MAAASATATIRSTYHHPQHMLTSYHYSDASTYPCAACERVVTGAGYRCDECDFNIHKACFSLPGSISFAKHSREHDLTLTRLKASRWCDVCKDTSHAGCYMYLCAPCNYDVHPRCVPPTPVAAEDDGAQRPPRPQAQQPQGGQVRPNRGGDAARAVQTGLHVVSEVAHTAESVCTLVDTVNTLASCDESNTHAASQQGGRRPCVQSGLGVYSTDDNGGGGVTRRPEIYAQITT
ncbi:hypothetical protein C2845_PM04G32330 [Panicum miliaceum]|uniref:Phorbol-ester/DAG-type domain-containing protein n=1 Tax=Panicum miliaceum TaxID=4540 RepID=A0A3L6QU52_PANMI|nr:hypothetical protein C2845_PM04G32330 [Panicum miliaceum]